MLTGKKTEISGFLSYPINSRESSITLRGTFADEAMQVTAMTIIPIVSQDTVNTKFSQKLFSFPPAMTKCCSLVGRDVLQIWSAAP